MRALYLTSVYLHILAVVVWLGGMAFLVLVLVPLVRRPEFRPQAAPLFHWVGTRFRPVGWACLTLLVVTGTIQVLARGVRLSDLLSADFWGSVYGRTLAWKLVAVAVILGASAVHDFVVGPRATAIWRAGGSDPALVARVRRQASWLGRVTLLLALLAVALGVALVRGLP